MSENSSNSNSITRLFYLFICTATAMIGYEIHKSLFWAIVDFFFCPFVWVKWMLCKEITLEIIKKTFEFFF